MNWKPMKIRKSGHKKYDCSMRKMIKKFDEESLKLHGLRKH